MSKQLSLITKNIKKYSEKKGISQDNLYRLASITLCKITKIESGETQDPRNEDVKKMTDTLAVGNKELLKK